VIAGNPPERRVEKLRQFWERITTDVFETWMENGLTPAIKGDWVRRLVNQASANLTMLNGAPGFFLPRLPSPLLHPTGAVGATSFYDTAELRNTLEAVVDFDRINTQETRFSVGAVNVRSGNFVYFDSTTHTIKPEHVMASGALPPGFAAIEIDGERYWDGGLISNTPLQWVMDSVPRQDTLAFQVDLWSARGDFPGNMAEVETRQKEIQYSSRTRANTDQFKRAQRIRNTVATLLESLPDDLKNDPNAKLLGSIADRKVYNIIHLIYRAKNYEGSSKDYEFSRSSMETHWRAGYPDTVRTLRHPNVLKRPANHEGVAVFDLEQDGRD
jgi:NTE family protein